MARKLTVLVTFLTALAAPAARAERVVDLGAYEAHYSLVPTLMLNARVLAEYGISRGRDRALLSVSVLDAEGAAVRAEVAGTVTNLLGQTRALALREVREGEAVYYLDEVRHDDNEVLRFVIEVTPSDGRAREFSFQQKMYFEQP